jgi:hypothetical protein
MQMVWRYPDGVHKGCGGVEMTLVKLDSGDYINTMYVIKTMTDIAGSVGKKNGQLVYLLDTGYQKITPADRDLIVAEMKSEQKLHNLKMMALQRGLIV